LSKRESMAVTAANDVGKNFEEENMAGFELFREDN
jgi:hypothetical protein